MTGNIEEKASRLVEEGRYDEALQVIADIPPPLSCESHFIRGRALYRLNRFRESEKAFRASLKKAEELNDPDLIARSCMATGAILFEQSQFAESIEILEKALDHCGTEPCPVLVNILNWLGQSYHHLDLYGRAAEAFSRGLEAATEIGFDGGAAYIWGNTGVMQLSMNSYEEAEQSFHRSLELHRKVDLQLGVADALSNIGIALLGREEFANAEPWLRRGIQGHADQGAYIKEAMVGLNLAEALYGMERHDEALEYIERGFELTENDCSNYAWLEILLCAAKLYIAMEMEDEAAVVIDRIEEFEDEYGLMDFSRLRFCRILADLAQMRGDIESLRDELVRGMDIQEEMFRKQNRIFADFLSTQQRMIQMKMKAEMTRMQKFESLATLSAGIAHGFNNSLHVILGSLPEIEKCSGESEERIEEMQQAAERAEEMCDHLLAFAGHSSMEPRLVDVNSSLEGVLSLMAKFETNIDLRWEFQHDIPPVWVDPIQLKNWIVNLIRNSMEALDGSGTITVTTSSQSDPEMVTITVHDDGSGIEENDLDMIFDPFYTTRGMGRGLGLSVVKGGVESAGGRILVSSDPGNFCQFVLGIPVSAEEPESESALPIEPTPQLNIALLDDDRIVRNMTGTMLRNLGHSVSTFSTGREFLDWQEKNPSPDCIILDMIMPEMNGAEVFREMRSRGCDSPVVLISGFSPRSNMERFQGELPEVFLRKPFSMEELSEAMARAMED